jgi:uncharacterized protein YacL
MNERITPSPSPDVPADSAPRLERPPRARTTLESPAQRIENEKRIQRFLMLALRMLFLVLLVTVSLLPFVGQITQNQHFTFSQYMIPFIATAVFGVVVLILDAAMPSRPLASIIAIYLGLVAGLVGALAMGALLDLVAESWDLTLNRTGLAYLQLIKIAIGITLCYLAVSTVLMTKDDFRLVIPYVEFAKQVRGVRPLLLDTSVLIDGRVESLGKAGFLEAPLVLPQFVIDELQTLADSSDKQKRARGRRGLEMVRALQISPYADLTIDPSTSIPGHSVDAMLLDVASRQNLRILTTDYNLNKVADIQGVAALNLNDLANTLRPQYLPGDSVTVEIIKPGEGHGQGVGYLADGTMVVVEDASELIGQQIPTIVTNALQTTAGRMIFSKLADGIRTQPSTAERMAKMATTQPRATRRPEPR